MKTTPCREKQTCGTSTVTQMPRFAILDFAISDSYFSSKTFVLYCSHIRKGNFSAAVFHSLARPFVVSCQVLYCISLTLVFFVCYLRYALFAVVNHSGTLEVGHYTCFIRQQQQVCNRNFVLLKMLFYVNDHRSYVHNLSSCN